jgi:competence protein ComEC
MAAVLAAFVIGVFALQQQAELPSHAALLVLAVALAAAIATAWFMARSRQRDEVRNRAALALLALAAALAGYGYAALRAELRLADALAPADEGKDLRIIGLIDSLPAQLQRGTRFEFAVERVLTPDVHVPARLALAWYGPDAQVRPGERWEFSVRLRRPHGGVNPGGFDLEAWLLERGLRATGYVRTGRADEAPQRLATMVWTFGTAIDRARDELRRRLQQRLQGERYGGVLIALVLGDQRAIAEPDWLLFNRTGIAHLVSISGLHITMIAGLAAWFTALAWRRSRRLLALAPVQTAAACAAVLAALAYCLLAGWGVPAQRTFFMLATVAAALVLRRSSGMATTLALAAAVVCALDPWAAIAPGFWLSFGAVAAIFWISYGRLPPAQPAGWKHRLRVAGQVQLAVTLLLVPLTLVLFRQVSLVSPLANAVAIPLVSFVVTPLALLGALFTALPAPLSSIAVPLLALAGAVFDALAAGLHWLAAWNWAAIALPAPPWWTLPLALAGVAWCLAPPGWPLRWAGALWLLPLMTWPPQRPPADELWVTALDVGQGMALLVETRDAVLLYDAGPRYSPDADAGSRVLLPYLRWRGIGRLDALVVSHLDSDHSGGTASIVASLPVGRVLTSIAPGHPALAGAPAERCASGQRFALGAAEVAVLHPLAGDYGRKLPTNALSCVLMVRLGAQRVLLTGDLPGKQEAELIPRESSLRATLAVAPHHGSRHSSSAEWVQAVAPQWVAVQAGYRNRFGHPDAAVVARWQGQGAKLVRTDQHGAAQWRLHAGGAMQLESWRLEHRRYWHNQPAVAVAAADTEPDEDAVPLPREPIGDADQAAPTE